MRVVVEDPFCNVGPALLLDAQFVPGWNTFTFDGAVMDEGYLAAAKRGECCFLKDEESRYFSGRTELYVDEPPPDIARYAVGRVQGLRLEVPTGHLRLVGLCALLKDGNLKPGEEDFASFNVPPGTYQVEVLSFIEHAARLEGEELPGELPLKGELPGTRWTIALQVLALVLSLLTLAAAPAWLLLERVPWMLFCGAVLLGWVGRFVLARRSGEHARLRHNGALLDAYLAALPEVPSYQVNLSRTATPPAEGGGLA